MNFVVVDTGVLVADVFWRHEPHTCLKAWLAGSMCPVISQTVFDEYDRVL